MERRPLGGPGLTGSGSTDLDRLLDSLGVSVPLRHAVGRLVRGPASEVQAAALPDAVAGRDVLAVAPTGSGKTLVLAVAVAHRLAGAPSVPGRPRALVLTPTRELASQVASVVADVGAGAGLRVATFSGGVPVKRDRRTLVAPVDVAVGTPGRLADLLSTGAMSAADVRVVVTDEADQLLAPSFRDQTTAILDRCEGATVVATTATDDGEVSSFLREHRPGVRLHSLGARTLGGHSTPVFDPSTAERTAEPKPERSADGSTTGSLEPATEVEGPPRRLVVVTASDPETVAVVIAAHCRRALFFVPRRDAVDPLRAAIDAAGVPVTGVTGTASPPRRAAAFADLASGAVRVLVTTDLAGRGLDISGVGHVVHVGPPHSARDLVHRSGRTGRGREQAGLVVAVIHPDREDSLRELAHRAGMTVDRVAIGAPDRSDATGARHDRVMRARLTELFGPEITPVRRRRRTAPPDHTRRPQTSRAHRPKRKRRT